MKLADKSKIVTFLLNAKLTKNPIPGAKMKTRGKTNGVAQQIPVNSISEQSEIVTLNRDLLLPKNNHLTN